MRMPKDRRNYFTTGEVVEMWDYIVCIDTLRKYIREGRVPCVRVGKHARIAADVAHRLPDYLKEAA